MEWNRLPRDKAKEVLQKLGGKEEAIVFTEATTEVAWKPLSFFSELKRFRLTNYATMPSFEMEYISDGETFYTLDGTANPIYSANENAPIALHETNVVKYLKFFFHQVQAADGEIYIITEKTRLPFLSSLTPGQQQSITNSMQPIEVISDVMPNTFQVKGTLYYDGSLMSATIHVTSAGHISIQDQTMLLQGIPFPQGPTTYSWVAADTQSQ